MRERDHLLSRRAFAGSALATATLLAGREEVERNYWALDAGRWTKKA